MSVVALNCLSAFLVSGYRMIIKKTYKLNLTSNKTLATTLVSLIMYKYYICIFGHIFQEAGIKLIRFRRGESKVSNLTVFCGLAASQAETDSNNYVFSGRRRSIRRSKANQALTTDMIKSGRSTKRKRKERKLDIIPNLVEVYYFLQHVSYLFENVHHHTYAAKFSGSLR